MSKLDQSHLQVLREAALALNGADIDTYLELRKSIRCHTDGFEQEFRRTFSRFFKLDTGGLTEEFKNRYFQFLFAFNVKADDPYTQLLRDLYRYPRLKGDRSLQCSFVSKLVAIHDDDRPIFDVNVQNFFGIGVPKHPDLELRIAGFVRNLGVIATCYHAWQQNAEYRALVQNACQRMPSLRQCSAVKVADFLVWTSGRRPR